MKKKAIVLVAIILVLATIAGATLAYLTDVTQTVTNTFTVGNVQIELAETDAEDNNTPLANAYKMVPGDKIAKDPTVTVLGGSEEAYVFVKVEASANLSTYITYSVDDEIWTALPGVDGVYYKEVAASDGNQSFTVLTKEGTDEFENGYVTVNIGVTSEQMAALEEENAVQPTLSFTAYACQKANVADAATAWTNVENLVANAVTKEVTVKNIGTVDAWCWVTIAVPEVLYEDANGTDILCYQFNANSVDTDFVIKDDAAPYLTKYTNDNGVDMVEFTVLYVNKVAAGETTPASLEKIWIDSKMKAVEQEDGSFKYYYGDTEINYDLKDVSFDVVVKAYAIQDDAFADVYAAYAAFDA